MSAPAIHIEHLVKTYTAGSGQIKRAIGVVPFDIPAGQIVGFLGPNGAGKTTTLHLVLGLTRPTSGSIQVLGHDATKAGNAVRHQIGYLPDVPGFPAWMTAPEFLRFAGSLFGIDKATLDSRVDSLLELAGLTGVNHKIGGFSRGMKQWLGATQALVNAPKLLMLDEPSLGLAPLIIREIFRTIARLREQGVSILLVEQNARAALQVADYGYVLETGEMTLEGPAERLANDPQVIETYLGMSKRQEKLAAV